MEYSNSLWINTDCKYNDINLSVNILVPNCCYVFIESINIFVSIAGESILYQNKHKSWCTKNLIQTYLFI